MTVLRHKLMSKAAAVEKALRMSVGDVFLYISYPPSVNANTRAVGGRVILSAEYRAWKTLVAQELMVQKAPRILGPVNIEIGVKAPDKRRRDGDNLLKPIFDALKNYGVIEDDNNSIVKSFSLQWRESTGFWHPCVIHITRAT